MNDNRLPALPSCETRNVPLENERNSHLTLCATAGIPTAGASGSPAEKDSSRGHLRSALNESKRMSRLGSNETLRMFEKGPTGSRFPSP